MTFPPPTRVASADFPSVIDTVEEIERAARAANGRPSLGDAVWRDLEGPGADSAVFLIDTLGIAHVARSDNVAPRHWAVGVSIGSADAEAHGELVRGLLRAVDGHVAAHGGGHIALWALDVQPADDAAITSAGYTADRELYEMRVALPLDEQPTWPAGITRRAFEPGRDDDAFLDVNNRAFAGHAEQGGWTRATLQGRVALPWFDPKLFLLAFDDEGLAGFNWLKIHETSEGDPRHGEIYVIGVHPRTQGTGLGRALAIAGLDLVYQRGIDTGSLFTAADNAPALKLYRSLGFSVVRLDRAYEREVAVHEGAS